MQTQRQPTIRDLLQYEELVFRSNAVIGPEKHLNDRLCVNCTVAFLRYLELIGDLTVAGSEIAIAGDLRDSTDRIMRAVAYAVGYAGYAPLNEGKIPTPALLLYAQEHKIPAVMVTASHVPEYLNGLHFYAGCDFNLPLDESLFLKFQLEVR